MKQHIGRLAPLGFLVFLGGCNSDVLAPSGYIAEQLRDVLVVTTLLLSIIIVPVLILIVYFAFKYHASRNETYEPRFSHSSQLELIIWSIPLLIIIWLGAITWVSTHKLDPYRPLDEEATGVTAEAEPLEIQVVSMDWKWLFIYPEYGVAAVNEVAAPVDRPIRFRLTSTEVMNAFYIPALAGMIYTMPSMETKLHAVINEEGVFPGRSSHYSGAGFSGMKFDFHGLDQAGFDAWVNKAASSGQSLDRATYAELLKPSKKHPVTLYSLPDGELYHDIVNRCVNPGEVCMDEMMAKDHSGHQAKAQHQSGAAERRGHLAHNATADRENELEPN